MVVITNLDDCLGSQIRDLLRVQLMRPGNFHLSHEFIEYRTHNKYFFFGDA